MEEMVQYSVVKKHIDEMDYCSLLSGGAPGDEFDTESREICRKITHAQTEEDIAQVIAEVFNRTFDGNNTASRFMDCAKKIYADLQC